jgi:lipopolysaccharide export system protein LptC
MNEKSNPTDAAEKDSRPLSFMQARTSQRAARARAPRTTMIVAKLRIALPLLALLLLIVLVVWPLIDPNKLKSAVIKNIPDLVVEDLHFTGLDSKNQPYSMTALRATRPSGLANIYDLDKPKAEITLQNGAWISGMAQYGRYDQETRRLWLGGDVQLFHDKGYQFTTDEAQIDIDESDAWGEKPVLIQGGFGEIRGQGFRALDSGSTFVVKGPAKAILNLHSTPASDKPAGTVKR